MSEELGSVLIAEIGSVTTRIFLVDSVEGETRLISQIEKPSTLEPPYRNASIAILEGATEISGLIGRKLVGDGKLVMPQNKERDGINHIIAVSSAAGTLSLIITAISHNVSAKSGLHASRGTYTNVLQVVTLDNAHEEEDLAEEEIPETELVSRASANTSWIEQQVEIMLKLTPDAVLMVGGLEGGATETIKRLAHIVALTTLRTSVDTSGHQRQDASSYPVVYAGNSKAQRAVEKVLMGKAELFVVDNVRPALEQERLEPTRKALEQLYHETTLTQLPGYDILEELCSTPLTTTALANGVMTRFLAERYQRRVLTLDVGSASTSAFCADSRHFHHTVLGTRGTGYSISSLISEQSLNRITRWLPFRIARKDLTHWMLNKLLRPHLLPSSHEDILIEHAVAREALRGVITAIKEEYPEMAYDMVVGEGGILAHAPHHGLALLTLLDALQPTAEESVLAIDIHLDTLGLIASCGALAGLSTDAAVTTFERDFLSNVPLATCVVPLGNGKPGKAALKAELHTVRGKTHTITVRHGQIARIPLTQGERAQLVLRPESGVHIGKNAAGAEVSSDVAAIQGSALGVVIDARGRPLALSEDPVQRRAQQWEWLVALGVEEGESPYLEGPEEEQPEPVISSPDPPTKKSKGEKPAKKGKKGKEDKEDKHASEPIAPTEPAPAGNGRSEGAAPATPVAPDDDDIPLPEGIDFEKDTHSTSPTEVGGSEVVADGQGQTGRRISLQDLSFDDDEDTSMSGGDGDDEDLSGLRQVLTSGMAGGEEEDSPEE
jgi:hypothetical protein